MANQKEYWEEYWTKENRTGDSFLFSSILDKVNIGDIGSYFELGCAPGSIMAHFAHKYNCSVSGVDIVEKSIVTDYLDKEQVVDYEVHESDLYSIETKKKYDFVASYGLVEHYLNLDKIIEVHKSLVADNGHLLITIPNIRFINYLVSRHFSKEILELHNFDIMNLKILKSLILDDEFEEIYANFVFTSLFQANENSQRLRQHPKLKHIYNAMNFLMKHTRTNNIPNRFTSPYIAVLAKKRTL